MNPLEDEILQRALQQLQEEGLEQRVHGAMGGKGAAPPNLIAQGYADAMHGQGLGKPSQEEQDLIGTARPMQQALQQQIEDEKYRKY